MLRFSHENPEIQTLYREALGAPGSELAEEWLHTDHHGWGDAPQPGITAQRGKRARRRLCPAALLEIPAVR